MTQNQTQFDQFTKNASSIGQAGMEAFIDSSTIFAKGCEDIVRTSVAMAQDSAEKQSAYAKDAMNCKTLGEWAEKQNKIAQANFSDFISSASKISEMSVKLLTESAAPLSKQAEKAMKKATTQSAQKAA